MRIREMRLIITFHTTTEAMAFEDAARNAGFGGRLIPVPPAITAGCGLAWSEVPAGAKALNQMILEKNLAYDRMEERIV